MTICMAQRYNFSDLRKRKENVVLLIEHLKETLHILLKLQTLLLDIDEKYYYKYKSMIQETEEFIHYNEGILNELTMAIDAMEECEAALDTCATPFSSCTNEQVALPKVQPSVYSTQSIKESSSRKFPGIFKNMNRYKRNGGSSSPVAKPDINVGIPVPNGKLATKGDYCKSCGCTLLPNTKFCSHCGNSIVSMPERIKMDKVFFSAIAPQSFAKGEYSIIDIVMYNEEFRGIVDEIIKNAEESVKETKSGVLVANEHSRIKIVLTSPDFTIEDNVEEQEWHGEYLKFSFAVELPQQYKKKQILFIATVYIDDVIATKLKFIAKNRAFKEQRLDVLREDVLSAFVSYASQDRNRVAMIIQGMKKARPDMDIFFDVDSLRCGEDWENTLWSEIDKRDVLFLCWSQFARDSKWVNAEWRYALEHKGEDCIEPIPIESPDACPPPKELNKKHFNDKLLYIIEATSK